VVSAQEVEEVDWRQPLIDYLQHEKLPNNLKHKKKFSKKLPTSFILVGCFIDTPSLAFGCVA